MFVNASIQTNKANITENGTAILMDLDKKIYAIKPAIKAAIAVRVPEGNIAHAHAKPVIKKKYLCFLILLVIPNMINATAVDAMPMPKLAASLYMEKYLIRVPPCNICVDLPRPCIKAFSAFVNPNFCCFQTQNDANKESAPNTY